MKVLTYSLSWPLLIVVAFLLMTFSFFSLGQRASAAGEFITTWQTDIVDPADKSITIPTIINHTYDYTVDWGDGSFDFNVSGDITHVYLTPGSYTVKISGTFPRIYFDNGGDRLKITSVDAWGDIEWSSMVDAFEGASNLTLNASDVPDLSNVTSLSGMFAGASNMDQPIGDWDVSNVVNLAYMFFGASSFNQDLSAWDVSNVKTFLGLFYDATAFNQDLSAWNTAQADSVNSMFRGASSFNQPVNTWVLDSAQDTRYMFLGASSFNQDVSTWRFPNVQKMEYMFYGATSFDQDVGAWNVNSLQRADFMFSNSGLSSSNFDSLLLGWSQDNIKSGTVFHVENQTYCNGLNAHDYLENTMGWFMFNDGFDSSTCGPTDIDFAGLPNLVIEENQDQNTLIGTFDSVDVDVNTQHIYSLGCSLQNPDNDHFLVINDQLFTNVVFDYSLPLDSDGDNAYILCVLSEDEHGNSVEKEIIVEITESEEVIVTEGEVLGVNTVDPEVQAVENGEILAATDDPAVLADTGFGAVGYLTIGSLMILAVSTMYWLLRKGELYKAS